MVDDSRAGAACMLFGDETLLDAGGGFLHELSFHELMRRGDAFTE